MSGAVSTYNVVPTWDSLVYTAEMTRQAAVTAGADQKTADLAYCATMVANAISLGMNPSTFQQAQAEANGKGHP
jgi:hypothetical protein